MEDRTCRSCGTLLCVDPRCGGPPRTLCPECRPKRRRARSDELGAKSRLTCLRPECAKPLTGKQRQWCSRACLDIARGMRRAEPIPDRECPVCHRTFTPTFPHQTTCPPTDEDRARAEGQPRSWCARRLMNHEQRKREGRQTIALDAPRARSFDCEQCGTRCVTGENVAPHASRFCGVRCKKCWHEEHDPTGHRERQVADKLIASFIAEPTRQSATDYRRSMRRDPCAYCGGPSQASDHIVPKCDGGPDDWTNRSSACHRCNSTKQSSPLLTFLAWRRARDEFEPWRQVVAAIHTRTAA